MEDRPAWRTQALVMKLSGGPYIEESPELQCRCTDGYRDEFEVELGGVGVCGGDHGVEAALLEAYFNKPVVPGLFLNEI